MKDKIPKLFIIMLAVILLIASIIFSIYMIYGDNIFEYSFIIRLIKEIISN
jgi:hypothetical protein